MQGRRISPRVRGAAPSRRQAGAVLVVVMIFLVVAAMLGVTTTMGTASSSREAATWTDRQRALFLADTVAAKVETDIRTLAQETSGDLATAMRVPTSGYYVRADGDAPNWMQWPADTATGSWAVGSWSAARYYVVYEGSRSVSGGTALLFTVVIRAQAQVGGTAAVLSHTFELMPA